MCDLPEVWRAATHSLWAVGRVWLRWRWPLSPSSSSCGSRPRRRPQRQAEGPMRPSAAAQLWRAYRRSLTFNAEPEARSALPILFGCRLFGNIRVAVPIIRVRQAVAGPWRGAADYSGAQRTRSSKRPKNVEIAINGDTSMKKHRETSEAVPPRSGTRLALPPSPLRQAPALTAVCSRRHHLGRLASRAHRVP